MQKAKLQLSMNNRFIIEFYLKYLMVQIYKIFII